MYIGISYIANTLSKCEFKTYENGEEVQNRLYYMLNTTAINGAKNAALIAASIFALTDKALEERLIAFRKAQTEKVLASEL